MVMEDKQRRLRLYQSEESERSGVATRQYRRLGYGISPPGLNGQRRLVDACCHESATLGLFFFFRKPSSSAI